jgi:hypothetical protein
MLFLLVSCLNCHALCWSDLYGLFLNMLSMLNFANEIYKLLQDVSRFFAPILCIWFDFFGLAQTSCLSEELIC